MTGAGAFAIRRDLHSELLFVHSWVAHPLTGRAPDRHGLRSRPCQRRPATTTRRPACSRSRSSETTIRRSARARARTERHQAGDGRARSRRHCIQDSGDHDRAARTRVDGLQEPVHDERHDIHRHVKTEVVPRHCYDHVHRSPRREHPREHRRPCPHRRGHGVPYPGGGARLLGR